MKKILTLIIIISFSTATFSQNFPVGANSAGMAYSAVTMQNIWSIYHNQAGLAYVDGFAFGVHYENRFGLKEFGVKSVACSYNTRPGAFGLTYTNYGFEQFSQNKFGLAYAIKLAEFISVGIQIDYFLINQEAYYGNIHAFVGEIGILAKPTDNFFIGAHVFNPWRTKVSVYDDERMPTIFRIGAGFNFTDKVTFTIETEKDLDQKAVFKTGLEYNIVSQLYLRTGISTNINYYSYAFGIGYKFKGISLDLAINKHPVMDYKTSVSIFVNFWNKK